MFNAVERVVYLSNLAGSNKGMRFKDLYKIVCRKEFLQHAYSLIEGNSGSKTAGVDWITKRFFADPVKGEEAFDTLSVSLRNRSYQPSPVRRIEIPKGNGRGKRPLGIPTLFDRIVQSSVKLILEAIFEPSFSTTSHGFRSKRSCQTAVNDIVVRNYDWVIEGDIKGCFSNIKHGKLLSILRKRIADEQFIALIAKFLKSGYQMGYDLNGQLPIFATKDGTPQGGIISPVLANIYLNEFDHFIEPMIKNVSQSGYKISGEYRFWSNRINVLHKGLAAGKYPFFTQERTYRNESKTSDYTITKTFYNNRDEAIAELKRCKRERNKIPRIAKEDWFNDEKLKSFGYVRYADDFVILIGKQTKDQVVLLKQRITEWFDNELELTLSQEKTKVTHATDGFTFLGYDIIQRKSENGIGYRDIFAQVYTPRSKMVRVTEKVEAVLRSNWNSPAYDVIQAINRVIGGWSRYHCIANNWSKVAHWVDHRVFWLLMNWLGKKHKARIAAIIKDYYGRSPFGDRRPFAISGDKSSKKVYITRCADTPYRTTREVANRVLYGNGELV